MKRRGNHSLQFGEKSLSIALFFILLVVFLVGLSIALKGYLLFKGAKFDGEHQFILELHSPSQRQLLSFAPDTNSAVILSFAGENSLKFGKYAEIPEDGTVSLSETYDSLYSLAQNLLFHPPSHLSLNIIDRIRLFLFVNNLKPTSVSEIIWKANEKGSDKQLSQLFTDHTAYSENLSIAVVNASGVSGLGSTVGEYLSHIGLSVISVTSTDDVREKTTIVYSGKEGYTTKRLMRVFGVQAHPSTNPLLSDVTVTLGKDAVDRF